MTSPFDWSTRWRIATVVLAAGCVQRCAGQGSPAGRYASDLVEVEQYRHFMNEKLYAHDGDDRRFGPEHDLCRANIESLFSDFGLTIYLHPFSWGGGTYFNVIGEIRGTSREDEIYVVAGHFDSVGNPGADDNASAVAALLEIARIAGRWSSEATIRLIAFDREEQFLIGSQAYVDQYWYEDFRGVISLDMVAYSGPNPDKARVLGRAQSDPLKLAVADALRDYAGLDPLVLGPLDRTDHAPFEWRGFQGCWLAEYNFIESNPHYHQPTDSVDTPGYIDYDYGASITRGVLGWLVDEAGLTPPHPRGDLNCDWTLDGADVDPFFIALGFPEEYNRQYPGCDRMRGDINSDGALDGADIDLFFECIAEGRCL